MGTHGYSTDGQRLGRRGPFSALSRFGEPATIASQVLTRRRRLLIFMMAPAALLALTATIGNVSLPLARARQG